MRAIPFSLLIIQPDRQRQTFDEDAMQELVNSIESKGLMHAIVVRPMGDGWQLVAGERRLRAIRQIHELGGELRYNGELVMEGMVPCVSLGDLDPYMAAEAELEENIKRQDLTWQERAAATRKLHELRQAQALDEGRMHLVGDTAQEIRGARTSADTDVVRKDLIVSRYLNDKDVAGAKSAAEAFKIVKKKEELERVAELGEEVGRTFSRASHRALQGDCIGFMGVWSRQEDGPRFDVILTDPPYGMGADEFGDAAGKLAGTEHNYADDEEGFRRLMINWMPLAFAVAKPQAHMYLCCDIDQFAWLRGLATRCGWQVFRTPIINHKINSGRVPWPEHGPRRTWEAILYAVKGKRTVNYIAPDLVSTQGDPQLGHGAQKPVALFAELLKRSIRPGDTVLDPFAGTGTIFPAAHGLRVLATGIEQDSASYGMCVERVRGLE